MKKIVSASLLLVSIVWLAAGNAAASAVYAAGSTGVDESYPNCTAKVPAADFGIVGVTNGIVYGHNTCLAAEAKNFKNLSLYMNTGLNASNSSAFYTQAQANCNGDVYCAAYNYGFNAANDAIAYANSQGIVSTKWWLDVETVNTWNDDSLQNQQSLLGAYSALSANGATTVGVYSTTSQWQTVTVGWKNGWANWGATTWTTVKQAQVYCTGHEFTGGPSLLMQFKSKQSKLDQDVAC